MASGLLDRATQASDQFDAGAANEDYMYSRGYGMGGYGGYDPNSGMAPGYGSPVPARGGGFEQYFEHEFYGHPTDNGGRPLTGPYAGMNRGEAFEKARDEYAKLSPEQRAPWEQRSFFQNDRSQTEMQRGLLQYPDQTERWGPKGPSWADVDAGRAGKGAAMWMGANQRPGTPQASLTGWSGNGARPMTADTVSVPPSSPSYSDNPLSALNLGNDENWNAPSNRHSSMSDLSSAVASPSYHQPDATPVGQIFKPDQGYRAPQPITDASFPKPTGGAAPGNPFDVARYGPRYTGNTLVPSQVSQTPAIVPHPDFQAPVYQPALAPMPMPRPAPPQAVATLGR